jgi:hypothetical protein
MPSQLVSSNQMRLGIIPVCIAALLLSPLAGARASVSAAEPEETAQAADADATTQKDQTDLSVTVYNSNLALVRDVRQIRLQSGVAPLRFEDVAANIMPATVHFRSLSDPAKLAVLEQNYEYDLLDQNSLLKKFVGRELPVTYGELKDGQMKYALGTGLLLSDNNGQTVWKIGDKIVTNLQPYSYPDLPGDLYSHPTLIWTLENRGADAQRVEASYLTDNMNWSSDYVLTVSRDEKSADLDGWVTLVNNSGTAYNNARLQLVAGNVHRSDQDNRRKIASYALSDVVAEAPQPALFKQENFSEFHLYTLDRRTSIQNNETKQISLLSGTNIPVEKYLLVEGQQYWYRNPMGIGNPIPQTVQVFYRFRNDEKSHLGMPLPAGTVRVYQADSKGAVQFAGENSIAHTPKDEDVRVHVGDAFDVVCERKLLDYKKIANNVTEFEYQITLRNHKDGPVSVEVHEPVGGDWEVVNSNFKWSKLDSTTLGFDIPVDKNGTATLDYRVRVKW